MTRGMVRILPRETQQEFCPYLTPTIHKYEDGSFTIDSFPPRILISRALLEPALPEPLERRFRTITFRFANAMPTRYRIVRSWPDHHVFGLELLDK